MYAVNFKHGGYLNAPSGLTLRLPAFFLPSEYVGFVWHLEEIRLFSYVLGWSLQCGGRMILVRLELHFCILCAWMCSVALQEGYMNATLGIVARKRLDKKQRAASHAHGVACFHA
jgi:hypothetical protein